ncbi:MAG: beta-ketoacyl-[acyl-carrier-protein] synthase family protein [Verrucomicrobiota bacterium]|nr:beta-ketoacyl-[acyl-carrier-protein] synthase family protein [Verrucomicrobiota bacterium]
MHISNDKIVITGIGLTAPNGNNLEEYRSNLLNNVSGIQKYEIRYIGETLAGICNFDTKKYQKRKEIRTGTRAGSIAIYCANEAINNSGLDFESTDKSRTGIYLGITEHGNVETETEIHNISKFDYDVKFWSHYHNPRTVANNPAGEVSINLGITGPHYTLGGACAAGNMGIIQGVQQLMLNEVDIALAGGVSESIHTFGIFAGFKSQGALATNEDPTKASRPFDINRNGIVVAEGGGVYVLERESSAKKRGAKIYAEIAGYCLNSDAYNFVLPYPPRQAECISSAIEKAGITPNDIDIVNTHATATKAGDIQECDAIRKVFGESKNVYYNNTKSFIGHAMGAAGVLELSGNIPSFNDNIIHPTINVDELDPKCALNNLVLNDPLKKSTEINYILNNSFGMVGINSTLIVKRYLD